MNAQKTLVSALSLTLVLALEIPLMAATIPAPEDVAKAPKDAITTESGLKHKLIRKGTGTLRPGARDTVKVHYTGWTTDGKMFDSSVARGEPIAFPLDAVIPGWTEGLQLMVDGEKRRFWIPGKLAYGDKPTRPGAPAGTLVFDQFIDHALRGIRAAIQEREQQAKTHSNLLSDTECKRLISTRCQKTINKCDHVPSV